MNQTKFSAGDPVRIISGTYKGAEGVIEDLHPECTAVRVHTKSGPAYTFLEHMVPLPPPSKSKAVVIRK